MLLLLLACDAPKAPPLDDTAPVDTGDTALEGGDCTADLAPEASVVHTTAGAFRGAPGDAVTAWKGIPFAEPPTGDLRFRPPEPRACQQGLVDALDFGPVCPQRDYDSGAVSGQEDCLHLNIWAPEGAAGDTPVLFFVHGGGNVEGSSSAEDGGIYYYDGAALAARFNAVVVTTNYRLGALGFLAHPAIEAVDGANGNWGLQDQQLAMTWVRDNIGGFGGDPARVLLFGESAGALDTCAHLASPTSHGLFSAALMQSGGCVAIDEATAVATGEAHAVTVGCDDAEDVAACLRALPVETLAELSENPISEAGAPNVRGFAPVVDGVTLTGVPEDVLADGGGADVPLVVGSNSDETSQWTGNLTEEQYLALIEAYMGRAADSVLALYPLDAFDSPREAWIAITTDVSFTCPARRIAVAAASANTAPVYRYFFSKPPTGPSGAAYGAWHGLELTYVFQHIDDVVEATGYNAEPADYALEAGFGGAWRALAANGSPDAAELGVTWPTYDASIDPFLEFGEEISTGTGVRTERCDLWDLFQ
jgi:para-nitrobenzyl esterase